MFSTTAFTTRERRLKEPLGDWATFYVLWNDEQSRILYTDYIIDHILLMKISFRGNTYHPSRLLQNPLNHLKIPSKLHCISIKRELFAPLKPWLTKKHV
jgi:hypothetical protein